MAVVETARVVLFGVGLGATMFLLAVLPLLLPELFRWAESPIGFFVSVPVGLLVGWALQRLNRRQHGKRPTGPALNVRE